MVIISHLHTGSQQNITHKHITQKVNYCISTTWEFPAGSLTCVLYLVSLLMLTRTRRSSLKAKTKDSSFVLKDNQGPRPRTPSLFIPHIRSDFNVHTVIDIWNN